MTGIVENRSSKNIDGLSATEVRLPNEAKEVTTEHITLKPDVKILESTSFSSLRELAHSTNVDISGVLEKYKNCPVNDGEWNGERGDSKWMPDREYVPQKSNSESENWEKILNEYDIDGIEFHDGEPDFSSILKGEVEIDEFSKNRTDNFDRADVELAKQKGCTPEEVKQWRQENGYTWHECRNMKTMQKVPGKVHNNITHSGGIFEIKKEAE